jgi:HK97 family phage portal protein
VNILGLSITRTKAALPPLQPISSSRASWWPWIRESYDGAWQRNVTVVLEDVISHPTAWACITLIAGDIAKLAARLVEEDSNGVWSVVNRDSPFWPFLRKPNHYQTRIDFFENWIISKLIRGNTYVLKERDQRGIVVAGHVLDPGRVVPLIAPDSSVYYQLQKDDLSGLQVESTVPASEIIHDRMYPIYHPLVGMSPIFASGVAAMQGLKIQSNQTNLFSNGSNPGGVLTAPGAISQETADRLKAYWDANYTGASVGKVAVLGDGLKFERMAMTAVDSELIKQLQWSDEKICSTFHVPGYMVGVGEAPPYNNIQAIWQLYYQQCLQIHIEKLELLLDEGLGLTAAGYGSEFDVDNLLRMDSQTMMETIKAGVGAGVLKPNEGRLKLNYKPVAGGDTPYMQEQNWPLRLLSQRELPARPPTAPEPIMEPDGQAEELSPDKQLDGAFLQLKAAALMTAELEMAA